MASSNAPPLNGDMAARAVVHSARLAWQASPSPSVSRKRLHLVGGAESGQVTSIVRYARDATFPAHDHPGGEEILVLEGTFCDEHGHWPAGTYLLNPEGFRHAPFSRDGCVLFVKLRQYPGSHRRHVALDTSSIDWVEQVPVEQVPGERTGLLEKTLYRESGYPESVRLERWDPGAGGEIVARAGGVEILVLEGSFDDDDGVYERGTWLRLPPGSKHTPRTVDGCMLYIKEGGVAELRSQPT